MMSAIQDGFIQAGGHRLHYRETGEGQPIVLLHTGGASAYQYEQMMPAFAAAGHRVIAWDMLGHGDSDPLLSHLTMEQHGALLGDFIVALDLDNIILTGASIGGYIVMAYAIAQPERIDRLIVAESPLRSKQWWDQNWAGFEAMCAIPNNTIEELKPRFREVTPELHKRWNIDRNKAGSWSMIDIAWALRDFDTEGALQALRVPTVFVMGSKGPTLNDKERVQSLRPDIRINVLEECGHFPMIDDPKGFTAVILA